MNEQQKKRLNVVLHIAGWTLFFLLPYILRPGQPRGGGHGHGHMIMIRKPFPESAWWASYFFLIRSVVLIPFFYLNLYFLFPKALKQQRYLIFILSQAAIICALYGYQELMGFLFFPEPLGPGFLMLLLSYVFTVSVAFGIYAMEEQRRMEQLQKTRENETLRAELQFLRWQISPHFLFNALNNMVALARVRSEKLEPMLINMSELMRYMLYETDERKISLQKEATYLQSYINLQSLRYDHKVKLYVHIQVPADAAYTIEPMLLIPFVENAFKHGIGLIEEPIIYVKLSVQNGSLYFEVRNKYVPAPNFIQDEDKGVGLANVQRRLNLLYEEQHKLRIEINEWYTVSLTISLTDEHAPLHNRR